MNTANLTREMRKDILEMTYNCGNNGAHIGGALSCVEIVASLYSEVMNIDIDNLNSETRDRFIMSKGHSVITQYAMLKQLGILSAEDLQSFKKDDSLLSAHPSMNMNIGIEISTGSLGQGLSTGVGLAMALKQRCNHISKVFVLLGDGECNEGAVWEAAMCAAHYNLDNLTAIIDCNGLQYDGATDIILKNFSYSEKWTAFGWQTISVNGHSIPELTAALTYRSSSPSVVIAHTVKGKGVSFMENVPQWHNRGLTKEQYVLALSEVEEQND